MTSLKSTMSVSQSQYGEIQRALEDVKSKAKSKEAILTQELAGLKELAREREEELENMLKEREEELKACKNSFDKESAIYKQKLEFN